MIRIPYKGKEYELMFTLKTAQTMAKRGFKSDANIEIAFPELFAGAFLAKHKFIKQELIEEIFFSLKKRDLLLEALVKEYQNAITSLVEDNDDGDDEGNAGWTTDD